MTAYNFAARQAQVKLDTEDDIAEFIKKTDFGEKLIINRKVTLNKTRHAKAKNKLGDPTKK